MLGSGVDFYDRPLGNRRRPDDTNVGDPGLSMRFHPKVTITIPVYNGSNYLDQAIESALGLIGPHEVVRAEC